MCGRDYTSAGQQQQNWFNPYVNKPEYNPYVVFIPEPAPAKKGFVVEGIIEIKALLAEVLKRLPPKEDASPVLPKQ